MAEFKSGKLTAEAYKQRRDETTLQQLSALTADPAFAEWQLKKATRENRARVASNALAVAGCLLLVLTMALLKPPAVAQVLRPSTATPAVEPSGAAADTQTAVSSYQLEAARQEREAALDAVSDLTLQLRLAEEAQAATIARLAVLEAEQDTARAAEAAQKIETERLVADMVSRLQDMKEEVAAAEAAAEATAALAEAAVAASEALAAAPFSEAVQPATCPPPPPMLLRSQPQQALGLGGVLPSDMSYSNASFELPGQGSLPFGSASASTDAALYTFLATLVCSALVVLFYLRDRQAVAAEAARAAQLAAHLAEASIARDTAEQSLALLETELQRRMKQLEEAQQRVADATSPKIGTISVQHTPGKGELPPPPASLIEKFLRDHNFLAVQEEQMQEWLEMEQQFGEMQAALAELQQALADKDSQLAAYEQDFSAINEHSTVEVRALEDQLSQVRAWLDNAQEELLTTQAALQEREGECRHVSSQLEAMRSMAAGAQEESDGHGAELLQQNLDLVAQLQSVTAAYEEMQAQLLASTASGTALALAAFGGSSSRPASAASTVPGTPVADLTREVQSCLEMMRATRAQLADRLAHSAGVCEAMIADCQIVHGKGGQPGGAAGEEAPKAFGSPATASPSALEREQEGEPAVLGISRRHHVNLPQQHSSSPVKKASGLCDSSVSPTGSVDGSMRQAWEAARAHVAKVRAQHTAWDLAGFVRALGFEIEEEEVPVVRADFMTLKASANTVLQAAAAAAATPAERALAGEAMQVLQDWEWPVHRINTPPPSPFWRMLGLQT